MQKHPERRVPTILFTRATSEWISRVNQKHKQLNELQLSAAQREALERWAETEFVHSTLQLDGVGVSRDRVARFVVSPSVTERPASAEDQTIIALLESLRKIESLAREGGRAATLTPDLLIDLHSVPGSVSGFRKSSGDATRSPQPVAPERLAAAVDGACGWYTAESFTELHPVEQASERAALVAASLFTMRCELPPIVVRPEMHPAYRAALDEGSRMNTKPMVELVAEAIEKSITETITLAVEQGRR